jgi:hypothetical protein
MEDTYGVIRMTYTYWEPTSIETESADHIEKAPACAPTASNVAIPSSSHWERLLGVLNATSSIVVNDARRQTLWRGTIRWRVGGSFW